MTSTPLDRKKSPHPTESSLNESLDGLCMELSRISAEILSINSGFQAEMQKALDDLRENIEKQYQDGLKQAQDQTRKKGPGNSGEQFEKAKKEIERIGQQMAGIEKEISKMLDDPGIELAKVIRKRTELVELKSYLNGLRFVLGESSG
jgi:flagellar biosynthesis/type III secretory pathway protein FliH